MQKILVIQTAFIGDVVLATGLLETLHRQWPDAKIDFLVRKGNEPLFTDHPFLNRILCWDKKKEKYKNLFLVLRGIRKEKYDLLINIQRFAASGFLAAFSGAKQIIGFDKNPFSFLFSRSVKHVVSEGPHALHEIERNHELIRSYTTLPAGKPKLYPSATDMETVAGLKRGPYLCIAPASVWFTKQFPSDQWVSFLDALSPSFKVYLLGAPGDKPLCDSVAASTRNKNIENLSGKLSFLESAALQKDAVMNYVNDSAPMHFASAVNAPVAAVYCSTIPAFGFGPLSDQSHIIETKEKLSCRPCGLHGKKTCPLNHFNCAYKISVQQLLEVLPA